MEWVAGILVVMLMLSLGLAIHGLFTHSTSHVQTCETCGHMWASVEHSCDCDLERDQDAPV